MIVMTALASKAIFPLAQAFLQRERKEKIREKWCPLTIFMLIATQRKTKSNITRKSLHEEVVANKFIIFKNPLF